MKKKCEPCVYVVWMDLVYEIVNKIGSWLIVQKNEEHRKEASFPLFSLFDASSSKRGFVSMQRRQS